MSDDEDYAASPYDGYDDFWDDDPPPDLADDLTQHVAYSPVYQDTTYGELEHFHSDWEWYSDDYYDDDPALLILNTFDGGAQSQENVRQTHPKRKRKRKLDEARDESKAQYNALASTIRGTVWAREQPDSTAIFEKGQQEKVALLTNWRDLFRHANGDSRTFGRGELSQDESWANEMSLADMGLLHERKISGITQEYSMDEGGNERAEESDNMDAHGDFIPPSNADDADGEDGIEDDHLDQIGQSVSPIMSSKPSMKSRKRSRSSDSEVVPGAVADTIFDTQTLRSKRSKLWTPAHSPQTTKVVNGKAGESSNTVMDKTQLANNLSTKGKEGEKTKYLNPLARNRTDRSGNQKRKRRLSENGERVEQAQEKEHGKKPAKRVASHSVVENNTNSPSVKKSSARVTRSRRGQ